MYINNKRQSQAEKLYSVQHNILTNVWGKIANHVLTQFLSKNKKKTKNKRNVPTHGIIHLNISQLAIFVGKDSKIKGDVKTSEIEEPLVKFCLLDTKEMVFCTDS